MNCLRSLWGIALVVLAGCLVLSSAGCSKSPAEGAKAETVELRFKVEGMTCDGCVNAVHDAIAKIDGVESCEVKLEEGSAIVHAKPGHAAVGETIARVVTELGYETAVN